MPNLIATARRRGRRSTFGVDGYIELLNYLGQTYAAWPQQSLGQKEELIDPTFAGFAQQAYKRNGVVFAVAAVRMMLFSEARFRFRQVRTGGPGDLIGTAALEPLETPWAGGTTGQLLSRCELDITLAGNSYWVPNNGGFRRLRPDWVKIILDSESAPDDPAEAWDAEILGYVYQPTSKRIEPQVFLPEQVAHYAPLPDPEARYRGMSWLTPLIREIMADGAATQHKLSFFEKGATPNVVVKLDPSLTVDKFNKWVELFEEKHTGSHNAYATTYLGGGADLQVVGANLRQLDFKATQGAGETRIAAAGGVPPVIVGLSEGLAASTYSNYSQARRRLSDGTMRPLWRSVAAAFAPLVEVPGGTELWYDDRDIKWLQEDQQDAAGIQQVQAATIASYITAGFTADSAVAAVANDDLSLLEHSGMTSVQLHPPGETPPPQLPPATSNPDDGAADTGASSLEHLLEPFVA